MLLTFDAGTTGVKAALFSLEDGLVDSTVVGYPTHYATGGVVEQDPETWWDAAVDATRLLLSGDRAAQVTGVAVSGQMMGALLLDRAGAPLRAAIIWADTRSQAECQVLEERVGTPAAYSITGHRLNSTYSLSKVMWVRRHEPAVWARAASIVQAKDFLALRLTGELGTDPSDASSTNAFDQRTSTWSAELLEAAEVDAGLMPPVHPSTAVIGAVTRVAAAATGLPAGTPVVMGGGDGPCAAVGAGVTGPESGTYCYLGTSSWVSVAADRPLHDPEMRTMTFNHVVPGRFVPTATMQAGGGSLEWAVETFAPGGGPTRYQDLLREAAGHEDAADLPLFLPHILGERSPYWNPRARGAFVGLGRDHDRGHLIRAVLEGVAMNLRTGLLAFADLGHPATSVDVIGGGASSDLWLQILADVWGLPVRRRSLVEEANALGAALIAAVGTGLLPDFEGAAAQSTITGEFHPRPEAHALLDRRYRLFLDAYRRLEPLFDELAG
ncbi:MAG: xylulokinase [Actinobacteria bacterium]|nr:xylulokinase [Actinomycetota bacterium]